MLYVLILVYHKQHESQRHFMIGEEKDMNNKEIRNAAGGYGLRLWQVAEAIGMNEFAFSRKLRKELPQEEKEKILKIIDRLAKEAK